VRTTLDIEEDVLQAAKDLAAREKSTAGRVLSRLARLALRTPAASIGGKTASKNGVPVFPAREGELITLDHVRQLMDEEGI
jgi:hypothetical protein